MSLPKASLFIDGSNMYVAAKQLGFDIDYVKLREFFAKSFHIIRSCYYTAVLEGNDPHKVIQLRPLIDFLDYNGFSVVQKPAKEFYDTEGRRKVKGNMDVEMAVDIIRMSSHVDHVILFSGDGDFCYLVKTIQQMGVMVTVVSSKETTPPLIADDLRKQADHFIELRDLEKEVSRKRSDRNKRSIG